MWFVPGFASVVDQVRAWNEQTQRGMQVGRLEDVAAVNIWPLNVPASGPMSISIHLVLVAFFDETVRNFTFVIESWRAQQASLL